MKNIKDTILEKLKINKSEIKFSNLDDPDMVSQQLSNKGDDREKAINNIVAELEVGDYKEITIKKIGDHYNYFIEVSEMRDGNLRLGFFKKLNSVDFKIMFFSNALNHQSTHLEFVSWKELRRNLSSTYKYYIIPENSILNDVCDAVFKNYRN